MILLRKIFRILVNLLPMNNTIIFESHSDFTDNSKSIFDYLIEHHFNNKYKLVWFVDNPENFNRIKIPNVTFIRSNPIKIFESMKIYYYIHRAKYGFFSHRMPYVKPNHGEMFVNLWHGSGLKKTKHVNMAHNVDTIHCSSDFFKELRIKNYGYKSDMIIPLGNPRNDLLISGCKSDVVKTLYGLTYKKVIVWLPTFKKKKNGFFEFVEGDNNFTFSTFCNQHLEEMNTYFETKDTLLIIKPHPMENLKGVKEIYTSNIKLITNNELTIKNIDLYSLLAMSDALITDVSSVYVDYLLLDKPIGFVVNEISNYRYGYHVENPLDYMPGKWINDYKDFKRFLDDVIEEQDHYFEQRDKINNLMNFYRTGFSERIVKYYHI